MLASCPPPPPQKPIIVWVHGTKVSSVLPLIVENEHVKKNFSFVTHAPSGFHKATDLDPKCRTYHLLKTLSNSASDQFPFETMYSFGWSGKLDAQERKASAQELYQSLTAITAEYKSLHSYTPPIILICHSHGGNLALNMASLHKQEHELSIQKTVLLACPVQEQTAYLIDHALFGTVYSLHSHVDLVQIIDPQRLQPYKVAFEQWQKTKSLTPLKEAYILGLVHPLFSERHFPKSDRLIQANICWKHALQWKQSEQDTSNRFRSFMRRMMSPLTNQQRGVLHAEFMSTEFIKYLPSILSQLDAHIENNHVTDHDINILI